MARPKNQKERLARKAALAQTRKRPEPSSIEAAATAEAEKSRLALIKAADHTKAELLDLAAQSGVEAKASWSKEKIAAAIVEGGK